MTPVRVDDLTVKQESWNKGKGINGMSNLPTTVEELLAGGSSLPSVKFPSIGDNYKGMVVDQEIRQQREFNPEGPGELKTWDDGKPMMQIVLTVEDKHKEVSRLYIKGRMMKVAKAALRGASMVSFKPGTLVDVTHIGVASNNAKEFDFKVKAGVLPALDIIIDTLESIDHTTTVEEDRGRLKTMLEEKADARNGTPAPEVAAVDPTGGLSDEQVATLRAAGLMN